MILTPPLSLIKWVYETIVFYGLLHAVIIVESENVLVVIMALGLDLLTVNLSVDIAWYVGVGCYHWIRESLYHKGGFGVVLLYNCWLYGVVTILNSFTLRQVFLGL